MIAGQTLAHLATRIGQTAAMVQRKVHRLGVQHVAARPQIGHIAGGQHPATS